MRSCAQTGNEIRSQNGSGNAKYQADKAAGALSSDASVYQSTDISFMRIEN